jgi:hypothetical protein
VPVQDTSDIEKIQIRVTRSFFLLLSKAFNDFNCALLLSPKNFLVIEPFIASVFDHQLRGIDQTSKKIISTMMRALQIGFNGLSNHSLLFLTKKVYSEATQIYLDSKFGSACLIQRADSTLFTFN